MSKNVPLLIAQVHCKYQEECELDGQAAPSDPNADLLFGEALPCAGLLHIGCNASRDLADSMTYFTQWCQHASSLCNFFGARHSRELFQEKSLRGPLASLWRNTFEHFKASLTKWRFDCAVEVAVALLEIQMPVQMWWSAAEMQDESTSSIINDRYFWAFTAMLLELEDVLNHLTSWSEGCPCHSNPPSVAAAGDHWRARARVYRLGAPLLPQEGGEAQVRMGTAYPNCPFKGCRAPELASGVLGQKLLEEPASDKLTSWKLERQTSCETPTLCMRNPVP